MRSVLVDTHALLWWLGDDPTLSAAARDAIADPETDPLVSAASVWEIAIKRASGKLNAPDDLLDVIRSERFGYLPVEAEHAWAVAELPGHHADPFDRLLIAQARVERIGIVTADDRFRAYDVQVVW